MFAFIFGLALVFGVGAYDSGAVGQGGSPDWSKLQNPDRPGHVCMAIEEGLGLSEEGATARCTAYDE